MWLLTLILIIVAILLASALSYLLASLIAQVIADLPQGGAKSQNAAGDLMLGLFRILEIERIDLQQREISLALLGAANMAFDRIAGAQSESRICDGET